MPSTRSSSEVDRPVHILGISGLYHDAAAALIRDGTVVAAAQEERFTRVKGDAAFPVHAIEYCLRHGQIGVDGLDLVVYYEKPITSFTRMLKSFTAVGLRGVPTFPRALESALGSKLWVSYEVDRCLRDLGIERQGKVVFAEHHQSHAGAAFFPSPFDEACILTFDGVGEWATTSVGFGRGARIDLLEELRYPASVGLLYSTFTAAAGFRVNGGEYKLMGLAPFGRPVYRDRILTDLIDLRPDGSFTIDASYFGYLAGRSMTTSKFDRLFDGPPRPAGAPITRRDCDLARSAQAVLEEIVLRMARHGAELTGSANVVLGGGVALNCVANARLRREGPFEEIWVQPAAGDAGSALGCALWAWHEVLGNPRPEADRSDAMHGAFLGPDPFDGDLGAELDGQGIVHEQVADDAELARRVAELLERGEVIAVCRGRMEFGPRALGNRSILADARSRDMQHRLNDEVKNRERFRPFAPAVLADRVDAWFEAEGPSPYMSFVAPVRGWEGPAGTDEDRSDDPMDELALAAQLDTVGSPIPAVTHLDGTARLQTVDADRHPFLHQVLVAFEERTGVPLLVNTSFNVRGEPIVATAGDAFDCFMATGIDWLVLDDCLVRRSDQQADRRWVSGDPQPAGAA